MLLHPTSSAVVLCNCLPSVTQKQYHKALSHGLRCCSSCLEPTASQRLAWGSPAEPAAEHVAGPRLQVEAEAPGRDPGSSRCCRGGFSCCPHPSPLPHHPTMVIYLDLCLAQVMAGEPTPTFQSGEF